MFKETREQNVERSLLVREDLEETSDGNKRRDFNFLPLDEETSGTHWETTLHQSDADGVVESTEESLKNTLKLMQQNREHYLLDSL